MLNFNTATQLHYAILNQSVMITKILVPTDFSDQAKYAFEVACQIAKRHMAAIHLIHLVELPYSIFDSRKNPDLPEALYFLKLAQQNFTQFRAACGALSEGLPLSESVKFNSVQEGIEEYIREHQIDIVVMGSHGSSGLEELFIGSNTEKIVRNVEVPVFVIKKQHLNFQVERFVFATDLENDTKQAMLQAVAFSRFFDARLKFVFINTPEHFKTTEELQKRHTHLKSELNLPLDNLEIYNDLNVERGILNYAKQEKADLIGIGTHGRKGLAHFLNGSLSEDLVNHAKRPVLTFKI